MRASVRNPVLRGPALALVAGLLGCGLFEELQDAESASASSDDDGAASSSAGDDGSSETAAACEIATDDRCEDQDTLYSCDPATGEVTGFSCVALCGTNMNFTCLLANNGGQHGCFCVAPGIDASTCWELETCLRDCVTSADAGCTERCFSRADANTIRTYGALVYCAHQECGPTCLALPDQCAACIEYTIKTGVGACAVERSLCETDATEDPY
jgi:hypothetical protein